MIFRENMIPLLILSGPTPQRFGLFSAVSNVARINSTKPKKKLYTSNRRAT